MYRVQLGRVGYVDYEKIQQDRYKQRQHYADKCSDELAKDDAGSGNRIGQSEAESSALLFAGDGVKSEEDTREADQHTDYKSPVSLEIFGHYVFQITIGTGVMHAPESLCGIPEITAPP